MLYIPISFNNTIQACYNDEKYTVLIKKTHYIFLIICYKIMYLRFGTLRINKINR